MNELMYAASLHELGWVKQVCDKGLVNVNYQNEEGIAALMLTSEPSIIKELCERGANVDIQDNKGRTPLGWCVMFNDLPAAKELCKRGAKVVDIVSFYGAMHVLLTKQQFRHNVLVLVGFLQIELLRCVHSWI